MFEDVVESGWVGDEQDGLPDSGIGLFAPPDKYSDSVRMTSSDESTSIFTGSGDKWRYRSCNLRIELGVEASRFTARIWGE
jgi:hypothetical protein